MSNVRDPVVCADNLQHLDCMKTGVDVIDVFPFVVNHRLVRIVSLQKVSS